MPKSSKSRNGAEKQAKTAEPQPEINGAGVLTPQEAELIRGYVRALEHLEDEGRELGKSKSAIYKEAKLNQLSTWAIRETVKRRRQDPGVLELQDDLVKIYSAIAGGAKLKPADVVPLTEAPAWLAGRADALAGHRKSEPAWDGSPQHRLEYQLGHDAGATLRLEAAEAIEAVGKPSRIRKRTPKTEHLGAQQAAGVSRARRKGARRSAA
jgi:uncharacterized protein (UPF0335 family)